MMNRIKYRILDIKNKIENETDNKKYKQSLHYNILIFITLSNQDTC